MLPKHSHISVPKQSSLTLEHEAQSFARHAAGIHADSGGGQARNLRSAGRGRVAAVRQECRPRKAWLPKLAKQRSPQQPNPSLTARSTRSARPAT